MQRMNPGALIAAPVGKGTTAISYLLRISATDSPLGKLFCSRYPTSITFTLTRYVITLGNDVCAQTDGGRVERGRQWRCHGHRISAESSRTLLAGFSNQLHGHHSDGRGPAISTFLDY